MMQTPAGFVPAHEGPDVIAHGALAFAFAGAKLLVVDHDNVPGIPALGDLDRIGHPARPHYLGRFDGVDCVALALADDAPAPPGFAFAGLRSLFARLPEPLLAIAARAFQVVEWDRTNRFCGRCGQPMTQKAHERAKACEACGYVAYPRISPAMMVLVTRGRELLLARANRCPGAMFSALAGFVEAGETIEDCVHREVREEVGLDVANLRYFASQSWSFPHSLMIAYTAEYAGGDIAPDPGEIADARWFRPDALPELPTPLSIARLLIETTARRLRGGDAITPVG
jgi:NAD+ diphosphatase